MPPSKRKSTEENEEARASAIAVYDEFQKSFKRLQKLWMDNEKQDAMRRANVWASYKRLGTLIDDEGPWRKALDAILQRGQI